jgi:hypothetical protein
VEPFEVEIGFSTVGGQMHPVICVPDGIKTPLLVKTSLTGPGGKTLLAAGDVYFRTLLANGTPSSAKLDLRHDFPVLLEVCFENREADIGRFLRRQLGARDTAALAAALKPFASQTRQRAEASAEGRFRAWLQGCSANFNFIGAAAARKWTVDAYTEYASSPRTSAMNPTIRMQVSVA